MQRYLEVLCIFARFRGRLETETLTPRVNQLLNVIGVNKLREITDDEKCPFVMYVGSKRLVKRKLFENYIDNTYSI